MNIGNIFNSGEMGQMGPGLFCPAGYKRGEKLENKIFRSTRNKWTTCIYKNTKRCII